MPGIVGLITRNPNPEVGKDQLVEMLDSMLHEPFYVHGTYVLPELGFYFGWVSHPDAFVPRNPTVNRTGDKVLIFTGEQMDHDDPANASGRNGGNSGLKLLDLYESKGEAFLSGLNGWFAGILIDLQKKTALLFNDRFGLHRVYFHDNGDSFAFASEAKALLSIRPEARSLDTRGIGELLSLGTTLQNRSIFSNVSTLPGGSSWTFDRGPVPVKRQYFSAATWERQAIIEPDELYDRLLAAMTRLLPSYFAPASGVGVSLTGGLDTRMMMAGRPSEPDVAACYTYGGVYRRCYDVDVAMEIAAASGLSHQLLHLESDFFRDFPAHAAEMVWLTEGCLDICGTHEVYFSRLARELAPIRVTGNYGSEVLRSVSTFKYSPPATQLFDDGIVRSLEQARSTFAEVSAVHPVTFAAFNQVPLQLYGRLVAAQSQLTVRSPYMDNEVVSLMYQAPPELRRSKEISLRLIAEMDPVLASIRTDMGYSRNDSRPIGFLRQLQRYVLFKAEWYYNAGMPGRLARFDHNPIARQAEKLFLGSHKIEHYRVWFRDQLHHHIDAILSDSATSTRPYLDQKQYKQLVQSHRDRTGNHLNEINKIITLELIQRSLLSGIAGSRGRQRVAVCS